MLFESARTYFFYEIGCKCSRFSPILKIQEAAAAPNTSVNVVANDIAPSISNGVSDSEFEASFGG